MAYKPEAPAEYAGKQVVLIEYYLMLEQIQFLCFQISLLVYQQTVRLM